MKEKSINNGKTQRGNGNRNQKANHIVSAVDENGFCLGEERVDEKSNEITAIPELLDKLKEKSGLCACSEGESGQSV